MLHTQQQLVFTFCIFFNTMASVLIDSVESCLDKVSLQTKKIVLNKPTVLVLQQCAQVLGQHGRHVTHLEVKGFIFQGLCIPIRVDSHNSSQT